MLAIKDHHYLIIINIISIYLWQVGSPDESIKVVCYEIVNSLWRRANAQNLTFLNLSQW